MKKRILVVLTLVLSIGISCERDDICAEDTPTTPQLILRFFDIANPDDTQNVTGLLAYGLDENDNIIAFLGESSESTRDSIAIHLNTSTDQTRFVLHWDYEIDDNGTPEDPDDDLVLGNPDVVTVNYVREDVYVSRACGFKTIFNDITFGVQLDADNWIINSEIVNSIVDNENAAHVKVFH